MGITTQERPGVYSSYDASSVIRGSEGSKTVGLVATCEGAQAGTAVMVTSYEQAALAFGGGETDAAQLVRLALKNGAGAVVVVPVGGEVGYSAAFDAMKEIEGVAVVLCDSSEIEIQQLLRQSVTAASAARRERIAVVGGAAAEDVTALLARAGALCCERVVLVAPGENSANGGLLAAAAVAGAIAKQSDPALPLGGVELLGLGALSARYSDNEIDLLVRGGVTALESVGGAVSVLRGVTTRTKTENAEDATWRELSTILVVDDVIPSLRAALRSRFKRAKNTAQSRSAIRSQVVLELENKLAREIITGYENVKVTADSENPTVCLVEFSFNVAHGLNQIWITAHISV